MKDDLEKDEAFFREQNKAFIKFLERQNDIRDMDDDDFEDEVIKILKVIFIKYRN